MIVHAMPQKDESIFRLNQILEIPPSQIIGSLINTGHSLFEEARTLDQKGQSLPLRVESSQICLSRIND